jgi:tetratricopeptide (TPR) repeat protein
MTVDLLEFDSEELYFDEPINPKTASLLAKASELYGQDEAETALMHAYFLEPEHPTVLVALYRYYYYQHRLAESLLVADRVLRVFAKRLDLPEDWRDLSEMHLGCGVMISMTMVRFYMQALKGAGYLELRLGDYASAMQRLEKVAELDSKDRLGALALLAVVREALNKQADPVSA